MSRDSTQPMDVRIRIFWEKKEVCFKRCGMMISFRKKYLPWPFQHSNPIMKKLKKTSSRTKSSVVASEFIPQLASNPTVEELDNWILALGGRELTPTEAKAWNRKVNWTKVPGEKIPLAV